MCWDLKPSAVVLTCCAKDNMDTPLFHYANHLSFVPVTSPLQDLSSLISHHSSPLAFSNRAVVPIGCSSSGDDVHESATTVTRWKGPIESRRTH